jgi:hypothetical protein
MSNALSAESRLKFLLNHPETDQFIAEIAIWSREEEDQEDKTKKALLKSLV